MNNERARAFYSSHGWRPDGHHRPDDPTLLGYRFTVNPHSTEEPLRRGG